MIARKSIGFALLLLVITSCGTVPIIQYHSLADVEFADRQTFTDLKAMKGLDRFEPKRKYIVFAAVDNDTDKYVLIAPKTKNGNTSRVPKFSDYILTSSVPIQPERAAVWLEDLQTVHSSWGNLDTRMDGATYEFIQRPVTYQSDNHKYLGRTIFKFYSNKSSEGMVAMLLFGLTDWQYIIRLDSKEDIEDLMLLLGEALKTMEG